MRLSYSLDVTALIIFAIIGSFHYDKTRSNTPRYWLFNKSLLCSAFTACFDILSSLALNGVFVVSDGMNYILSVAFFVFYFLSFGMISLYAYYLLYERISKKNFKYVWGYLLVAETVLQVLLLTNYWTGCFFTIHNGIYTRGPLTALPFTLVVINLALYYGIYFTHRQHAGASQRNMIRILSPTFLCMGIAQLVLPNTMMVGLILAILDLMFYIASQNSKLNQDSLTDLPTRQLFFNYLQKSRLQNNHTHAIMIFFENLQDINHAHGVSATDNLIFRVARQLEQVAPRYTIYRYSSTRFLLVGDFHSVTSAEQTTRLIMERFAETWDIENEKTHLHVHIAHMDFMPKDYEDDVLINQLEYTLNAAKGSGDKNSVIYFDSTYRAQYERKLQLLDLVKAAIEAKSFEVYYQPIFSQKDKRFVSAEALARLRDENGNLISPGEFIPLAEEHGLLKDITWIIVEKVCQFLQKNSDVALSSISINISSEIITDVHFLTHLRSLITQYQVPAEKIKLEITERTISSKPHLVKSVMMQLDSEGIRFSLDDFGTGYSNFEAMLTLPFKTVKLDRSLMKHIDSDERYRNMIRVLVEALMSSRLEIVAEGLETEEQILESHNLNIDYIQGFYYAKPMPGNELLLFLNEKIIKLPDPRPVRMQHHA